MEGPARAGRHAAEWDLRDGEHRGVDAGVYFLRLVVGGRSIAHKVVVMR